MAGLKPVALAAAAAGALSLAACGSSSSPDSVPTASPTASAAPSSGTPSSAPTSAVSSAAPTPAPTTTASGVVGPAGCTSSHLALQQGTSQGAAGSTIVTYILRNAGTAPCTLYGFPGVSFLSAAGAQLGQAATRQGTASAAFTVQPGQVASFKVQIAVAGCAVNSAQSQTVRVFPPNNTGALEAPAQFLVCTAPSVTAVQNGLVAQ